METIFLVGAIGDDMVSTTRDAISALYRAAEGEDVSPLRLIICSTGGDLWLSQALADAVEYTQLKRPVHAVVTGAAMSGAMWALLPCRNRAMTRDAVLMVHGMSEVGHYDVKGQRNEMALNAELVQRHAEFYARYTQRDAVFWLPILEDDSPHYYFALEAMELGMIDETIL